MKRSEEILQVRTNKQLDPDRSQLRRVLEARFVYERMSAARPMFAHLLAIVGVLIGLQAIWPDLLSEAAPVLRHCAMGQHTSCDALGSG
jgi:hypothetical protein